MEKANGKSGSKRSTWCKLYLAVDAESHIIEAAVVTTNDFKDSELVPNLLEQMDVQIEQLSGDSGYDSHEAFEHVKAKGAQTLLIPPKKNTVIS